MNNEQGISNYEVFLSSFCFAVFTLITKIEISVLRDQIFSYHSTFIIPCSIFDIGIPVKNIKNNLALMGVKPSDKKREKHKALKGRKKKEFYFGWQDGYGAFSISKSSGNAVIQYIQNQQDHHRLHTQYVCCPLLYQHHPLPQ